MLSVLWPKRIVRGTGNGAMTRVPEPRALLLACFEAALAAVDGRTSVSRFLRAEPIGSAVHLVAIGKAAVPMAQGALDVLGAGIVDAIIVTKDAAGVPLPWPVREAGHPVPDLRSLEAGTALRDFVRRLPRNAVVLVLLSGGASALVEQLPDGVSLDDLRRLTDWLLGSGLDIAAMNRIRKRVSRIKGGRLAEMLHPRPVHCLAISDVPGNEPGAIGSGPLVAAAGSEPEQTALPDFVNRMLAHSAPLPLVGAPCFDAVHFKIIATLEDAKQAAARAARTRGAEAQVEPKFLEGDAAEAGTRLAQALLKSRGGVVHVWGGETTVRLPSRPGRGGRNQQLALAAALELQGHRGAHLLAVGTDGTDGPTADAGALVDGGTVARAAVHGLSAAEALARADAGTFLEASGDLVNTGPTGTNVMDLVLGWRPHT